MTGSFAVNHNTFNNALGLYVKNLELRSFAKMLANNAVFVRDGNTLFNSPKKSCSGIVSRLSVRLNGDNP